MKVACTIINERYVPFARVLRNSLQKYVPDLFFEILVVDRHGQIITEVNSRFIPIDDILHSEIARDIYNKYAHTNTDHLRWSLKSVFLLYLLEQHEKVMFLDPDLYFIGDPAFLFDMLEHANLVLSPHWSEVDPHKYEDGLYSVMRNGIFNGGLVGATRQAKPVLRWWAGACHYRMEESPQRGVFVDQKYLDLFPLLEENTAIIRHPGCNLTNINLLTCRREWKEGRLWINGNYPPVFIHFTRDTIYNIRQGNDEALRPFLDEYILALHAAGYSEMEPLEKSFLKDIKTRARLRTRVKRWLFRLAEKL